MRPDRFAASCERVVLKTPRGRTRASREPHAACPRPGCLQIAPTPEIRRVSVSPLCAGAWACGLFRRAARVEMIPVQNRIETQEIGPLSLPPPERAQSEHHHVALSERNIQRGGPAGERLAPSQ